jgi:PadR family transcriptional regulator, regulatory protein PadR
MAGSGVDLFQGTLDMLILKAVSWGPVHGYSVAKWLQEMTNDVLQVEEGSLYPALHRMEAREWIAAEWGVSENNRRAKFYRLTPKGRKQLHAQASTWSRFADAVGLVMTATTQPA